ncbi:oligopeptide ABC transporter, periplasmic oligopeptide-binding protein [Nostoc commune NIES-4072]|uniref:Oligopeptide ABC transporter, periplasmic oligopeptide-binding protein n=1 Tax=Nostoc commune NIES-4072 TaxID=2005467 RepID=A0A2R5FRW2_NOSCO|nr:ABC transporter substrate-binding protein [Nostoc commune]BBD68771.1 oligopeptide ABC transporter, periplasmic oligopeptide-binding protein [Nostoc commune HK-02]GBG20228.1 oligopeptide ABC transporter, periplasmic oligopeptide-binding protein [Nostoc commune NIES-4072]
MIFALLPNRHRGFVVLAIFSLFLIFQIALISCNPTNFKSKAAQVSQWVTSTIGDPKTFNYAFNQEYPHVFLFTTEGLTTLNGITGKIEPALAVSWDISDDKKRVAFTLRENLKWSDGEPLTVDDVIFTYEDVIFNPQIPTDWKDGLKIGSSGSFPKIRKISDRQIEFILPEPFAPFLYTTAGASTNSVGILPKHALAESLKSKDTKGNSKFLSTWGTDTEPSKIIVNGAYKIESYTPSQRVVFRRNPYYWRKDSQGNQLPYIERIVWQIIESTDTIILQFRSGGLDTVTISPENFSLLKREEKRGKFTIYNGGPEFTNTYISFNLNKGRRQNGQPVVDSIKSRWFNTVAFRQAVAYALDRQTMLNNVFRGIGVLQNSPIEIQSPYYFPPEKGLKVYEYNQEKAKKLLLSAGFKYNENKQLLDADGNRVRFSLLTNAENKTRVLMGAQIKQDLSKIGIQVDFNPIAFNTLTDKLSNSLDWECYLLGFVGGIEPNDGANVWLPEGGLHTFNQKLQAGQESLIGWQVADWEAEIGRLYIKAARELDEVKRKEIYAETQRLSQEYLPYIYLVNPLSLIAVRDRIQNVKFSALGSQKGTLWNKYELKITE